MHMSVCVQFEHAYIFVAKLVALSYQANTCHTHSHKISWRIVRMKVCYGSKCMDRNVYIL